MGYIYLKVTVGTYLKVSTSKLSMLRYYRSNFYVNHITFIYCLKRLKALFNLITALFCGYFQTLKVLSNSKNKT